MKNKVLVWEGILLDVIDSNNQTWMLNAIYNYGNSFYLKFMWDIQRIVHRYNLLYLFSIFIADCIVLSEVVSKLECAPAIASTFS